MDDIAILVKATLSLKDSSDSKKQIISELPKLEGQLQSDTKGRVKITAGLDITKSKNLIQSQLATITNQANAPTIKVGVDVGNQNAVQNISAGLKDVQVQAQQTAKTVNQTSQSITNLADKFIQPIKPVFDKDGLIDVEKTITKVQRHFKELGEVSIKGIYGDNNSVDSLDKMIVRVKTLSGETRSLNFELDKTSNAFYLKSGTSDNSGVEKLINAQLRFKSQIESTTTSLKSQLDTIKANYSDDNSTKYISNADNKNALTEQYNKAIDAINRLNNADSTTMASMKANAKSEIAVLQQLVKQFQNAEYAATSLRTKDIGTIKINQQNDLSKFIGQVSGTNIFSVMKSDIDALGTSLSKVTDSKSLTTYLNQLDNVKTKFEALKSLSVTTESNLTKLQALQNQAVFKNNASNPEVVKAKADIAALIGEYQNLKTQLQGNVTPEGLKQIEATLTTLNSRFSDTKDSAKVLQTALARTNGQDKLIQKTNLLIARIEAYRSANSKAEKSYGDVFDNMLSELRSGSLDNIGVDRVSKQFQTLRQEISLTGKVGKNFWEKLKEQTEKFSSWMTLTGFISGAWRNLQKMVTNVIELDSAMSNLKKVTDETETSYAKFLKNTSQQAKDLKIDLSDLVNQTAEWSKKGYNMSESGILSKSSGIYSVVGEVYNKTAVQDLTTVMKSYNMTVEEAIDIVDRFNNISNKYSVSAADIGKMLSNSISSLSIAGNSLDQAIAMGTTITEITGDASEAGNTLKVLSMRLRGASTEIENIGESTDGMAESTAKLREKILALTNVTGKGGFDIMAGDDSFKSTYEIMQGISEVWQDISDVNQAALIELIAGKQRGNTVSALLTNMAQANNILNDSLNSSGSAMEEYELYLESIEGRLQGFKTSFESLSSTVIDSELVKGAVDAGTGVLNFLDETIDKLGTIPTLLTAISAGMAFKNVGELLNTPPYAPLQLCA